MKLEGGNDVSLKAGQTFTFTTDKSVIGNSEMVAVTYEGCLLYTSVPSTPQSWAEYSDPKSRWTARKGLFWGAAEGGPIETGEIPPGNQNTVCLLYTSRCV